MLVPPVHPSSPCVTTRCTPLSRTALELPVIGYGRGIAVGNGVIGFGGDFQTANGQVSAFVARMATTCPALATTAGSGCVGAGGPNVLAASNQPWVGATFHATATGMPATGLAVVVTGWGSIAIPLASILAPGAPGCSLLSTPDLLEFAVPAGGLMATSLPIPNVPSFAGTVLNRQVVALELDAAGQITSMTSTNALALTIGWM
jgi:hypothetical protein